MKIIRLGVTLSHVVFFGNVALGQGLYPGPADLTKDFSCNFLGTSGGLGFSAKTTGAFGHYTFQFPAMVSATGPGLTILDPRPLDLDVTCSFQNPRGLLCHRSDTQRAVLFIPNDSFPKPDTTSGLLNDVAGVFASWDTAGSHVLGVNCMFSYDPV